MAGTHSGRKRIRIITDPAKYRRHRRMKLFKRVRKLLLFVLAAGAAAALIWFLLAQVGSVPRSED